MRSSPDASGVRGRRGAVGSALGRNPIPIIVPCHRVIRTDRTLGGYTGGLRYKRALLRIEGRDDLIPSDASSAR